MKKIILLIVATGIVAGGIILVLRNHKAEAIKEEKAAAIQATADSITRVDSVNKARRIV